jgi:hypothetical protein
VYTIVLSYEVARPYFVLLAHLRSGTSGWPTRLGWSASFLGETGLGAPPLCIFVCVKLTSLTLDVR